MHISKNIQYAGVNDHHIDLFEGQYVVPNGMSYNSFVISDKETMTYTYYQNHVKPQPKTEGRKGWVCKVCGYVHEGSELPDDFVCPLCKHGASDFEPLQ